MPGGLCRGHQTQIRLRRRSQGPGAALEVVPGGETEACQNARSKILNQGIGRSNERLQGGAPFGRFEIQNNGALVAVEAGKVPTETIAPFTLRADRVATRGFNLDDVGTEIAQNLSKKWARQDSREVHDSVAAQRLLTLQGA